MKTIAASLHKLVPISVERYADQPITLRTRITGMATTFTVCAAVASIGLWQTNIQVPTDSKGSALSVLDVASFAAPSAPSSDAPISEPTKHQEIVSEPEQQQPQPQAQPQPQRQQAQPDLISAPSPTLAFVPNARAGASLAAAQGPTVPMPTGAAANGSASAAQANDASQLQATSKPSTSGTPSAPTDSAERDRWEREILAALNRVKRYPRAAAHMRQEGISWVCVTLDRRGKVRGVKLHKGSGHSALDQEALAMVGRANPLPRPPATIKSQRIDVTVPIAFSIDQA